MALYIVEFKLLLVGLLVCYILKSIVLVHACDVEMLCISCNMGTCDLPDMYVGKS